MGNGADEPHAFISYVREDAAEVDRLQRVLEGAGIKVWRDTKDLWPGEDWEAKIRQAITDNALVFIACFSDNSVNRPASYQNDELLTAVDEFRKRQPGQPWLIPVRFSACSLPQLSLGAGRTLDSLQRVDLWGDRWDEGVGRLVAVATRLVASAASGAAALSGNAQTPVSPRFDRSWLLDPTRQIDLEEAVTEITNSVVGKLRDLDVFPAASSSLTNDRNGLHYVVKQIHQYWITIEPLLEVLITGCTWGSTRHDHIWTRAVQRVANTAREDGSSGQQTLTDLRQFPLFPLMYAASVAGLSRGKYSPMKAIAVDVSCPRRYSEAVPLVGIDIWSPFSNYIPTTHVLALARDLTNVSDELLEIVYTGNARRPSTPVSDHLHDQLRGPLRRAIPDDDEYTKTFDEVEVLLGVLATDVEMQLRERNQYSDGSWVGSFTFRYGHATSPLEERMYAEAEAAGESWEPLAVGLFDGSAERALRAFKHFVKVAAEARKRRY